jgi:hypothetical protein
MREKIIKEWKFPSVERESPRSGNFPHWRESPSSENIPQWKVESPSSENFPE